MNSKEWDSYVDEYHEYIISPLAKGVVNPIYSDILKINDSHKLSVADIGTGRGELIPFLSEKFKQVYAIDFSKKMLESAKKENQCRSNVCFIRKDIRQLSKLKIRPDICISVNSILLPSLEDVEKSFDEITRTVPDGGRFIGIFPSMESVIHNSMLIYKDELSNNNSSKAALAAAKKRADWDRLDFLRGIYDDGQAQKFYYRFELLNHLKKRGFKNIRIKKVKYPWGKCCGDYPCFPGEPRMWDWYVSAGK